MAEQGIDASICSRPMYTHASLQSSGISIFDNMVAVAVAIVIAIVIGKVTPTRTQSCRERGREREIYRYIMYLCGLL